MNSSPDSLDHLLDSRGLLIAGIHEATWEQIDSTFARFQRSDRRIRLLAKLREYLDELKKVDCAEWVVVDGSFVMQCVDEPDDIDCLVQLHAEWDVDRQTKPFEYNVLSRKRVKSQYGLEIIVTVDGSNESKRWLEFFEGVNPKWCEQFGWPQPQTKGLLRIKP